MCGICGHYNPNIDNCADLSLLQAMNKTLTHRGPDSQGVYLMGNIGMAMRRLAIIDMQGGAGT
jgi:asparagine synthase (glutamine-hydrolysing)